nr:Fe-S-containing protein [uncultured Anaerobutyricum sp.]
MKNFTMDQVGESAGGCNPWPILEEDKTETDSEIKISYDFLKESSDIFANWKID